MHLPHCIFDVLDKLRTFKIKCKTEKWVTVSGCIH